MGAYLAREHHFLNFPLPMLPDIRAHHEIAEHLRAFAATPNDATAAAFSDKLRVFLTSGEADHPQHYTFFKEVIDSSSDGHVLEGLFQEMDPSQNQRVTGRRSLLALRISVRAVPTFAEAISSGKLSLVSVCGFLQTIEMHLWGLRVSFTKNICANDNFKVRGLQCAFLPLSFSFPHISAYAVHT